MKLNLLTLRPARNVRWETLADGRVVLIAPKFRNRILIKVLVPFLKHPDVRLTLDRLGSDIWNMCDGETEVRAIAERLEGTYGKDMDPEFNRLARFFRTLERERLVTMIQR